MDDTGFGHPSDATLCGIGRRPGADGLLYLSGHDKPEVYVLAAPRMGPKLVHMATISVDIEGQAIAWDDSAERVLIGISRSSREIKPSRFRRWCCLPDCSG